MIWLMVCSVVSALCMAFADTATTPVVAETEPSEDDDQEAGNPSEEEDAGYIESDSDDKDDPTADFYTGEDDEPAEEQKSEDASDSAEADDIPATDDADADEPTFSEDLILRAGEIGLSPEAVKSIGSSESVEAMLGKFYAKTPVASSNTITPEEKPAQQPAETSPDDGGLDIDLNTDDFDPKLIEVIKQVAAHGDKRVAAVEAKLASVQNISTAATQFVEQQKRDVLINALDAGFEGLGDPYRELLGSGPTAKISKASKQYENREKLAKTALAISDGYRARGAQHPDDSVVFSMAAAVEFQGQTKTMAKNELVENVKQRSTQVMKRVAKKKSGEVVSSGQKTDDQILARLKSAAKTMGLDLDD